MSHNICRSMLCRNYIFWPAWHRCWSLLSESLFKFRTLLDAGCRSKITMLILCVKEGSLFLCLLLTREALCSASLKSHTTQCSFSMLVKNHICCRRSRQIVQQESREQVGRQGQAPSEQGCLLLKPWDSNPTPVPLPSAGPPAA